MTGLTTSVQLEVPKRLTNSTSYSEFNQNQPWPLLFCPLLGCCVAVKQLLSSTLPNTKECILYELGVGVRMWNVGKPPCGSSYSGIFCWYNYKQGNLGPFECKQCLREEMLTDAFENKAVRELCTSPT